MKLLHIFLAHILLSFVIIAGNLSNMFIYLTSPTFRTVGTKLEDKDKYIHDMYSVWMRLQFNLFNIKRIIQLAREDKQELT